MSGMSSPPPLPSSLWKRLLPFQSNRQMTDINSQSSHREHNYFSPSYSHSPSPSSMSSSMSLPSYHYSPLPSSASPPSLLATFPLPRCCLGSNIRAALLAVCIILTVLLLFISRGPSASPSSSSSSSSESSSSSPPSPSPSSSWSLLSLFWSSPSLESSHFPCDDQHEHSVHPSDSPYEAENEWPLSLSSPLTSLSHTSPSFYTNGSIDTLILVPCHTLLHSLFDLNENTISDSDKWLLREDQRGELPTFLSHISKGVEMLTSPPLSSRSLLMFSGGFTRVESGPISEAQSYYLASLLLFPKIFGGEKSKSVNTPDTLPNDFRQRVVIEDRARDSYENLLFSLCRFFDLTHKYPKSIIIIGFEFKRKRFENLHREAIRWEKEKLQFVGIDPPYDENKMNQIRESERLNAYELYSKHPYGCPNPHLLSKRTERNPFKFHFPYGHGHSCPQLREIFHFCQNDIFQGKLPWDKNTEKDIEKAVAQR